MTDTPITDSRQAYEWSINNGTISADFARGLERENTQLAARVKELEGLCDAYQDRINIVAMQMEQLSRSAKVGSTESERLTWKALAANLRNAIRSAMKQEGGK